MVEIADAEQLKTWLAGRPNQDAVIVASRAACRSLPMDAAYQIRAWEAGDDDVALLLASFWDIATAWLAGTWPSHAVAVRSTGRSAFSDTDSTARSAFSAAISDTDSASYAADSARFAAGSARYAAITDTDSATGSARYAADSARSARSAFFAADFAVWGAVSADATALQAGQDLSRLPLWPGDPPEGLLRLWRDAVPPLLARDENWEVWVEWYEDRLAGDRRPIIEQLELDRVLVPTDADWDKGAAHVNAILAGLELKHRDQQDPAGSAFADDGERITEIAYRDTDSVATDPVAIDLHGEAVRLLEHLAAIAGEDTGPNSNRFNDLLEMAVAAREAIGNDPAAARPGLLIPRLVVMETARRTDDRRRDDQREMEGPALTAGERGALDNATAATKLYVQSDPHLGDLYARHLNIATAASPDPEQTKALIKDAVESDAATEGAGAQVTEAVESNPTSEYTAGTVGNFLRRALKLGAWMRDQGIAKGKPFARWMVRREEWIVAACDPFRLSALAKLVIGKLKQALAD